MQKRFFLCLVLAFFLINLASAEYQNYGKFDSSLQNDAAIERVSDLDELPSTRENLANSLTSGVEVVWPEEGYYYITDFMQLEVNSDSTDCSYSLNGGDYRLMEIVDGTNHKQAIYDLADNMAGDPYIVDFNCGGNTAQTYFWIKLDDLNNYFIRSDIGEWYYIASEIWWEGNDDGHVATYDAYYKNHAEGESSLVEVVLFDNGNSLNDHIAEIVLNESIWNSRVQVVNGQNVYFLNYGSINAAAWKNGNALLFIIPYDYENYEILEGQVPLAVLEAYLNKYPSDLRDGFCGDGQVDIFNDDGFAEECDENFEVESCGLGVGECSFGEIRKECNGCMWGEWGECDAPQPANEICDGKDNNCDGFTDEGDVCLTPLTIFVNSPFDDLFDSRKVQLNITLSQRADELSFIDYSDIRPKEKRLCKNCLGYGFDKAKFQSFKEGFHNLTFFAKSDGASTSQGVLFVIDSKVPKILRVDPRGGLASGEFYVQFAEENPVELALYVNDLPNPVSLDNCLLDNGKYSCMFEKDLGIYDGQEIIYYFALKDAAGRSAESKKTSLEVDTTKPSINDFSYVVDGRKVEFKLNLTEKNFKEAGYVDLLDPKQKYIRICSRLSNGLCAVKKTFKIGQHVLEVSVFDSAGNTALRNVEFVIS